MFTDLALADLLPDRISIDVDIDVDITIRFGD